MLNTWFRSSTRGQIFHPHETMTLIPWREIRTQTGFGGKSTIYKHDVPIFSLKSGDWLGVHPTFFRLHPLGVIRDYDAKKGFGFIRCQGLSEDWGFCLVDRMDGVGWELSCWLGRPPDSMNHGGTPSQKIHFRLGFSTINHPASERERTLGVTPRAGNPQKDGRNRHDGLTAGLWTLGDVMSHTKGNQTSRNISAWWMAGLASHMKVHRSGIGGFSCQKSSGQQGAKEGCLYSPRNYMRTVSQPHDVSLFSIPLSVGWGSWLMSI